MKTKQVLVCSILVALTTGVLYAAPSDEARSAIEAGNKELFSALKRGDTAAMAALYTANAQLFPPNREVVRGKKAIEELFGSITEVKGGGLTTTELEVHGDTAIETGTYKLLGEDGSQLDKGNYLAIWKRQEGKWKIHRDIWNSSVPRD
jgi:ketosteroid isomerase-like protein